MAVVEVVHVLGEHRAGVLFVVDQQPVGAFLAQAAAPAFDAAGFDRGVRGGILTTVVMPS